MQALPEAAFQQRRQPTAVFYRKGGQGTGFVFQILSTEVYIALYALDIDERLKVLQVLNFFWQDFATQVFHWRDYQESCTKSSKLPGKYVTPTLAEHMAGSNLKCQTFSRLFCSSLTSRYIRLRPTSQLDQPIHRLCDEDSCAA